MPSIYEIIKKQMLKTAIFFVTTEETRTPLFCVRSILLAGEYSQHILSLTDTAMEIICYKKKSTLNKMIDMKYL